MPQAGLLAPSNIYYALGADFIENDAAGIREEDPKSGTEDNGARTMFIENGTAGIHIGDPKPGE